jgi:hypothetical protein
MTLDASPLEHEPMGMIPAATSGSKWKIFVSASPTSGITEKWQTMPTSTSRGDLATPVKSFKLICVPMLTEKARLLRRDVFSMIHQCGDGHPGAALSITDMLTALYFHVMRVNPQNPEWPERDRFILSKGHGCPSYSAALARHGFFPVDWRPTLRKIGSPLQGHPVMKKTPGVDMTTGSLGHGIPIGAGMAAAGWPNWIITSMSSPATAS